MIKNDAIETSTVVEESKIPNHWSSAAPKKLQTKCNYRRFTPGA